MDLEGTYAVHLNGEKVGTAILSRCGLYYEVQSRCAVRGKQMVHLLMGIESAVEDLGLLIPANGGLELKKRIPVRRIGEGKPSFFLRNRNEAVEYFVPVKPGEAFPYLHRLKDAAFAVHNGQTGVVLGSEK